MEKFPENKANNIENQQKEIKRNLGAAASNAASFFAPKHFYENLYKEYPNYSEIIKPFTEKIDENMAADINFGIGLEHYDNGRVDETAIKYFSKILGIKTPKIIYKKMDGDFKGQAFYNRKQDAIYIFKYNKNDLPPKGQPLVRNYGRLRVIAHELWHAHQCDEIQKNNPRGNFYQEGMSNYIKGEQNLVGYYTQPIEVEANMFAYETNKKLIGHYIKGCERLAKKAKEANDANGYNLRISQIDLLENLLTQNPTSQSFDIDAAFDKIQKQQCGFQNNE
ncbi:hypothetical protein IJJ02_03105 [Candidatus Saccharibacteria bacterium]|nr:hypothetical protein [Candidatus Saccharibacteria bacterium]